jgi:hypothetical protein
LVVEFVKKNVEAKGSLIRTERLRKKKSSELALA